MRTGSRDISAGARGCQRRQRVYYAKCDLLVQALLKAKQELKLARLVFPKRTGCEHSQTLAIPMTQQVVIVADHDSIGSVR